MNSKEEEQTIDNVPEDLLQVMTSKRGLMELN